MNTEARAPDPAMIIEFLYQVRYGRAVSLNKASKLTNETFFGSSSAVLRVPEGLSAAEMMNTTGKSAQNRARIARPCRHQTRRNEPCRRRADSAFLIGCEIARGRASLRLDISSLPRGTSYGGILRSSSGRR